MFIKNGWVVMNKNIISIFKDLGLDLNNRIFQSIDKPEYSELSNLYEWKNSDEQRAIEFTTNAYLELHIEFVTKMMDALDVEPKRILDIGCDDGLLTCALAMLFPNSEIVGIEQHETSLNLARKFGLKINNTPTFMQKNLFIDDLKDLGKFDVIISKNVFHEFLKLRQTPPVWRTNQYVENFEQHSFIPSSITTICNLLNPTGLFFSTERIKNAFDLGMWARWWCETNMTVDTKNCSYLKVKTNEGNDDKLPFLIFKKGHQKNITFQDGILLSHIWINEEHVSGSVDEFNEQLIGNLLQGETILHQDVHAVLLNVNKLKLIQGWWFDNGEYVFIEEVIETEYGTLCLQLMPKLQGASLRLLENSPNDYIEERSENIPLEFEVIEYSTFEEFESILDN
jgi:SAM-dependent methyltransferase